MNVFEPDFVVPFLIFSIPIIAIIGGITAGIVKTMSQQRLIELAQRERIAAIERGVDPAKLPPLPTAGGGGDLLYSSPEEAARRRAEGLLIAGIISVATGIGLAAFLSIMEDHGEAWAVGIIPFSIGIALLLSAWIVRPRGGAGPRAGA